MAKKRAKPDEPEKSLVETAKDRYERAKAFYDTPRILSIEDTKFAMGDSDNGWQWPAEIYRDRANVNKKPCLTVNITAQHCNQIINNIRQNRPSAKVSPVDDFADIETAKIIGGMLRAIQRSSNADTAHDLAAEHALYGGEGYWRVITEYEDENSFDQVIRIKPIPNPLLVYIDPDAKEPDRSDARWGFVFEDISKEQCREDHPDCDPASWAQDTQRGWVNEDTVRRAEYFWCDYKPDTLYLLEDGTTVHKSDMPDDYRAEMAEGEQGGAIFAGDQPVMGIVASRPVKRKVWKWAKLLGGEDKPVMEQDWPGSLFPVITVVGKELNVNGEIVRKGVVRDLKDPARMVNYSFSAAVESLALQNKVPYIASIEAIEGFEDIWGGANLDNRAYLPWNALGDDGTPLPKPERQAPALMATAQVQMLQLSTEQMRAASGQQNANFGIRSEAQSGVGIQRLKAQGEIATFHFPDNLARALKYEASVIIDLIPKVYESKRVIRILGLDGKEEAAMLNPDLEAPIADVEGKVDKMFNPGVGKYDVAIDTGPSYQTQRQEAADAMTELAGRYPPLMDVAGDLVLKTYDFPMAEELSERMKKLPGIAALQDDKSKPQIPPEVQAQMEQMQQQVQQLSEALENASAEVDKLESAANGSKGDMEIKRIEANTKAYAAITQRLIALGPLMRPEEVGQLAAETKREAMEQPDPGRPPSDSMGIPQDAYEEQPADAGFFTPEQGEQFPAEMPATGANPGLA